MAFSLIPDAHVSSIFELPLPLLQETGIRLLLLDLDNTIIAYGDSEPDARFLQWIALLRGAGVEPFILSNSRKPTRVTDFAKKAGLPFLRRAGKPRRAGFVAALAEMGCTPAQTAMVGDQIFTDILGANRSGIFSILVNPIRQDTPFRRLRFHLESPFRHGTKRSLFP